MCKPVCVKITRDDKITSTDGSRGGFRLHDIYGWYTIYTETRIALANFAVFRGEQNGTSSRFSALEQNTLKQCWATFFVLRHQKVILW